MEVTLKASEITPGFEDDDVSILVLMEVTLKVEGGADHA